MAPPDPVPYAIPVFLVTMLVERWLLVKRRARQDARYEKRDWFASMCMGLGSLAQAALMAPVFHGVMELAYRHRIATIEIGLLTYPLLFLAEDFAYYWMHRLSHERRIWWAWHVNHHSSERYNLGTALRQTWTSHLVGSWLLWVPLAFVGFRPEWVYFQMGVSLLYQYWIHTELIGVLPAPVEWLFNTPSHHRVHHGRNERYLDKNYGGILIVWDRIFSTFEPESEDEPVSYGLVHRLGSTNPLWVAMHEWVAIARDVLTLPRWSDKLRALWVRPADYDAFRARAVTGRAP
jgi:sterol desaturase/sphingolipid hydroxylase (fatty acid hydroxylase superfamily)